MMMGKVKKTKTVGWLILVLITLCMLVLYGCFQGGDNDTGLKTESQIIKDVTPQEAFAMIEKHYGKQDFVILDVRTPEEFDASHISEAVNLDYYSETFGDELDRLDRDKSYLVYCRSGVRSADAANMMKERGFREVYNLLGGITDWQEAGLITVK